MDAWVFKHACVYVVYNMYMYYVHLQEYLYMHTHIYSKAG